MLMPATGTTGGRPSGDISTAFPGNNGRDLAALIMEAINTTVTTPKVQCQLGSGSANTIQFWVDVPGTTYNSYKLEIRTSATVRSPDMGPYTFTGGIPPGGRVLQPRGVGGAFLARRRAAFAVAPGAA